jgi:hypothetical protein
MRRLCGGSFKGDFDTVDLIEARSLLSAPA